MTYDEFYKSYDKYIYAQIRKHRVPEQFLEDVHSDVWTRIINAGTIFDLPHPAILSYLKQTVKHTLMHKHNKGLKTYEDMTDEDGSSPEEWLLEDSSYSPETERQDIKLVEKAQDIADSFKALKKLCTVMHKKVCKPIGVYLSGFKYKTDTNHIMRYNLCIKEQQKAHIFYLKSKRSKENEKQQTI